MEEEWERGAVEVSTWGLWSETGLSRFLSALCFKLLSRCPNGTSVTLSDMFFLLQTNVETRRQISHVRSSTRLVVGSRRVEVRVDREEVSKDRNAVKLPRVGRWWWANTDPTAVKFEWVAVMNGWNYCVSTEVTLRIVDTSTYTTRLIRKSNARFTN